MLILSLGLLKGVLQTATTTTVSSGCWPFPVPHTQDKAASQGPRDPRSGTHFCCKSLGGFVTQKSGKRSLLTEQMPSSGSLTYRTDLRNQSIPLLWKQSSSVGCQVVSMVWDPPTPSIVSKAHFQHRRSAFVLIRSLYSHAFQLLSCGDLGDTTFQFVSSIVHFPLHFVYVINYAYYIK